MSQFENAPDSDTRHRQLTFVELYSTLDRDQRRLADMLEDGIFEPDELSSRKILLKAHRRYTGFSDTPYYVNPARAVAAIEYVFEKIDYVSGVELGLHDDGDYGDLPVLERQYDLISRLATYSGNKLSDNSQLVKLYFPMRQTYREAVQVADAIGDDDALIRLQNKWAAFNDVHVEQRMAAYDQEIRDREAAYSLFIDEPYDDRIWERVLDASRWEDLEYIPDSRITLGDISAESLTILADNMRHARPEDRWKMLSRQAPNGMLWIDVLPKFRQYGNALAIAQLVQNTVRPGDTPENPSRHKLAVDLNGESGALTERLFRHHVIADRHAMLVSNAELRYTANKRLKKMRVDTIDAIPTDLPFPDESQSLLFSDSLTRRMGKGEEQDFYLELSRVLMEGGMYIEASGEHGMSTEVVRSRWKYVLAAMIEDTLRFAGRDTQEPGLDHRSRISMLRGLGMRAVVLQADMVSVVVITKGATLREIGSQGAGGMPTGPHYVIESGIDPA